MKLRAGFTLMEVLVGIVLISLIFLGVITATVILLNSNARVKQIDHLEQAKNDLQLEFANSIRWAKSIAIPSPAELVITDIEGTVNTYQLDTTTNQITKNGAPLTSVYVEITNLEVKDYSRLPVPAPRSIQVFVEMQHRDFTTVRETFRLVVSQRAVH